MWQIKTFKTRDQMLRWIARNGSNAQWNEIFVNNAFGVEYRRLRKIG
jgi:hypothetical protein